MSAFDTLKVGDAVRLSNERGQRGPLGRVVSIAPKTFRAQFEQLPSGAPGSWTGTFRRDTGRRTRLAARVSNFVVREEEDS